MKLNKTKVTLTVGESTTLKMNGTSKKVTWSTSNKKIATVYKGKVTAKKKGTAKITAKVGSKTYACKVTVVKPAITGISMNEFAKNFQVLDSVKMVTLFAILKRMENLWGSSVL